MVKIKYNNMMISQKPLSVQQQPIRSKLRSSGKLSLKEYPVTGASSDEKVVQQIQKQIDNQQSVNGSKSTDPIQDDLKVGLFESALFCMRTRRTRYDDLPKSKLQDVVRQSATKQLIEKVVPVIITPLVEEAKPQQLQKNSQLELLLTPLKLQHRESKVDQNGVSKVSRRSGRKNKKNAISQVPFRKFQDSFEQKIVVLINKIYQKKSNEKDIEIFIEKLQKITQKELYNPYIISGIQTVFNLLSRPCLSQVPVVVIQIDHASKFNQQIKRLSSKIWQELGKTEYYENVQIQEQQIDFEQIKPKFIKKIYRLLIETKKYQFKEAREKSFHISQSFFSNYDKYSREEDLFSFFREKKFLAD